MFGFIPNNTYNNNDFAICVTTLTLIFIFLVTIIYLFKNRRKTEEFTITDAKKFLDRMNLCLYRMGYHLETERENFITYKRGFLRISITYKENKAIIIGSSASLNKLVDLYSGKKV